MVRGEGMAPFHDHKRSNVQRWRGDNLQATERASISPRQDAANDNKDGGFGRGNGRGRSGNKGDGDAGGGGGSGGGGGGGGGGENSKGGNGRGRFGNGRGDSDNNGRGNGRFGGGRGGGNGGNTNNDSNEPDNGKGGGGSDGGGGRGNGNGNGRGNNGNNGNGNGRNNGDNSNGGNGGGSRGGSRGGGGSRSGSGDGTGSGNGNDTTGDANVPPASEPPAETPTDVPPPAASAVDPGSPSPIDQETPETSAEPPVPAPSSTPAPDAAVPSDSPDPGTVALVSDVPPEAPAETSTAPTPAIPQLASDAAAPPPDVTPPPPAPEPSISAEPSVSLTLPPSLPQSTTVAAPESLPTSIIVEPNNPGDTSVDRGSEDGLGSDVPSDAARAGLDPTVERVLISVGSIGAFILICFVGYLIWRAVKNSGKKRSGRKARPSRGGFFSRFLPRFASRNQRAWENLDDPKPGKGSPPSYREKASTVGLPQTRDFYALEKSRPKMPQEVPPQPQPQLQPQAQAPKSVDLFVAAQRPNISATKAEVQGLRASSLNGLSAASTMVGTHQAQDSFSSTAPMHFDTMMTEPDVSDTARSRMGPGVFFNQSEMARQPSIAYDPARRQVNRTSVMSSLSSGFGDGDIVLPPHNVARPPQAAVASSETATYSKRFSWSSHTTGQAGQRDTTYTQSSEDMPPRFRSLNSWIDQQTGRIKRAQQREAEQGSQPPIPHHPGQPGVPGVHNPPREPSFNLMMDDEEPRKVEYVIPTSPQ